MRCKDFLSNNKKKEKVQVSTRNSSSNLPPGEQMNQCVPLAHYLACFAKQRTSGLRQRNKRSLGFWSLPDASSSEGTRTKTGQTASMTSPRWGESAAIRTAEGTGRKLRLSALPALHLDGLLSPGRPPARCELSRPPSRQTRCSAPTNGYMSHPTARLG